MKEIIFIRHAKSSWSSGALSDFDRPLNGRGKRDAPFMAKFLAKKFASVDGVIQSPAKRIQLTSKYFIKEFNIPQELVLNESSIYHGSLHDIMDAVQSLPEDWNRVLLFCHNPGITWVANYFNKSELIENVPTCGIIYVSSDVNSWSDLNNENGDLQAFFYPKQFL